MTLDAALADQIDHAVALLKNNEVIGLPTETVYGLAGMITSEAAIQKIFSTKQRPFFDPLIVHVASIEQAQLCTTEMTELALCLAKAFWPGPLTLVLPKTEIISDLITSGLPSVGIRWPKHNVAEEIILKAGAPLAAPSANKFGRTSPTKAQHVRDEFSNQVFVVDGDASEIGIESTVLSIQNHQDQYTLSILRKGAILQSQIDDVLKSKNLNYTFKDSIIKNEAPGQMKHHYMPDIPFVICRNTEMKLSKLTEILNTRLHELPDVIEHVQIVKPKNKINKIEFLKLSQDPTKAAREIYSQLRSASQRKPDALCFIQMPVHQGELWESIFDRLYKAASLIID